MSLYATEIVSSADEHRRDCARWVEAEGSGEAGVDWHLLVAGTNGDQHYRLDDTIACTCRCGPIAYQGSHVFPSDEHERRGSFELAAIPGFLVRGGYDEREGHGETVQPWLRISLLGEDGLLDLDQVKQVHAMLGDWLGRVRD